MSIEEFEAAKLILPIQNCAQVRSLWVGVAGPVPQTVSIPSLFGDYKKHFYTVQADGAKLYVAMGYSPTLVATGALDDMALGIATMACWAIPDGQQEHGFLLSGGNIGSGPLPSGFQNPHYLHFFTGTGSSSTGYIRIRRSSVGPQENLDAFHAPGWARTAR